MAKLPKKKLTKPAKPAPKPPAKTTKAKKPKTVAKPKTTKVAKPPAKTSKAAAAKRPKKAPPTKTSTGTKPKTAVKLSKSTKAKPPKKPTKPAAVQSLMDPGPIGGNGAPPAGGDGVAATPLITSPLANATVPAGVNLVVTVSTNRADLGYTVTIQDITPPGPAPAPTAFPGPNPTTNPFSVTIPAANLAAGRTYRILVTLDTASSATPHTDSVITINT